MLCVLNTRSLGMLCVLPTLTVFDGVLQCRSVAANLLKCTNKAKDDPTRQISSNLADPFPTTSGRSKLWTNLYR